MASKTNFLSLSLGNRDMPHQARERVVGHNQRGVIDVLLQSTAGRTQSCERTTVTINTIIQSIRNTLNIQNNTQIRTTVTIITIRIIHE